MRVLGAVVGAQGVTTKSIKIATFAQRKNLLAAMKDAQKRYQACEEKMISMEALTVRHTLCRHCSSCEVVVGEQMSRREVPT